MTDIEQNQRRDIPGREIRLRRTDRDDRPIALVLGLETGDGQARGASHGVLLTTPAAHLLLFDLADALGLAVRLPRGPGAAHSAGPPVLTRSYNVTEHSRIETEAP
jgi:hypothetical protein